MPVQTTSAICSRWILRFTIFIVLYWVNTTTNWDFLGIFYRSTLKRRTKVISSLQEKCHCQSYTLWCRWYSSYRACFGCSYWKRARKHLFFCGVLSLHFQFDWFSISLSQSIILSQPYCFPHPLYYECFGVFEIIIAHVPFNKLPLHR